MNLLKDIVVVESLLFLFISLCIILKNRRRQIYLYFFRRIKPEDTLTLVSVRVQTYTRPNLLLVPLNLTFRLIVIILVFFNE